MKAIVRWSGVLAAVLSSACQPTPQGEGPSGSGPSTSATIPADSASIAGTITTARTSEVRGAPAGTRPDQPVSSDDTGLVGPVIDSTHSILVESQPGTTAGTDKAWVTVRRTTPVLSANGTTVANPWSALMPGARVRVWFEGPVRESYPVQADAKLVVID